MPVSEEIFKSDASCIQKLIQKLDLLDDEANAAVREGMKKGARIINEEQKRLISGTSPRLSDAIRVGKVYATKKRIYKISTGYPPEAFPKKGFSPGLVGMIFEFGRPGKKGGRKMTQNRNGESVEVRIGSIQPVPHIRKGFDSKVGQATELTEAALTGAVNKLLEGNK